MPMQARHTNEGQSCLCQPIPHILAHMNNETNLQKHRTKEEQCTLMINTNENSANRYLAFVLPFNSNGVSWIVTMDLNHYGL